MPWRNWSQYQRDQARDALGIVFCLALAAGAGGTHGGAGFVVVFLLLALANLGWVLARARRHRRHGELDPPP